MSKKQIKHNQAGMVSILVTMFLMIVISLIVIGFAKITRREQREVLDRQLSTQAFYAAESGVNDAVKKLQSVPASSLTTDYTNNCSDFINANSAPFGAGSVLTNTLGNANVQYTCLLVDPSPTSLSYQITDNVGKVVPMTAKSGTFSSIDFSWEDDGSGSKTASGCQTIAGTFPTFSNWGSCNARILRIDVTPITGDLKRSTLLSTTKTIFLQPMKPGSGTTNQALPGISGTTIGVDCSGGSSGKLCNFSLGLSGTSFTVRIRSIYAGTLAQNLVISPKNGSNPLEVTGAQAVVDATGKASDVLRRIQVHVDLSGLNGDPIPAFAVASHDTICKRYTVVNGQPLGFDLSGTSGFIDSQGACDPHN